MEVGRSTAVGRRRLQGGGSRCGWRRHGSEEEVGTRETGAGLLLWLEEGDEWRG